MLAHERDNEHSNMMKLVCIVFGFMTIGLLRLADEHSHAGTDYSHCNRTAAAQDAHDDHM